MVATKNMHMILTINKKDYKIGPRALKFLNTFKIFYKIQLPIKEKFKTTKTNIYFMLCNLKY
jgi:hypothetical protein